MAGDPLNIRAAQVEYLEVEKTPAIVRRVQGQVITSARDPLNLRAVAAEFLEVEKSPAVLRRVQGQVLTLSRDPLSLRAFQVEYLEQEVRPPSFVGEPWPKLLAKINEANNTNFTVDQVTYENPISVNLPGRYNSRLTLRAKTSSFHSGTVDIYFPRFSIRNYLKGDPKLFDQTGMNSVHDALTQINQLWGLALTPSDVLDLPFEPSGSFYVTVAPTSLYFIPGERYRYGTAVPLSVDFAIADLGGFNLPTMDEGFPVQNLDGFA